MNLAEYVGENFYAYTSGIYEVKDQKGGLISASVSAINIVILSFLFCIPVTGEGIIQIRYLKSDRRVFESEEGAIVLQEKVDASNLPQAYEKIFSACSVSE